MLDFYRCQLNRLVTEKWVDGWDDPRLMTLAGLRRRGVTSTAINAFVRGIGITRRLALIFSRRLCLPGTKENECLTGC